MKWRAGMDNYNVLIIDDNHINLNAMKRALIKFGYEKNNIYPKTTHELKEFSVAIARYAERQKYDKMYYYIFKIIEKYSIAMIILDLNHDKSKAHTYDRPNTSSGEKLVSRLIKNKLHEKIPILVYTRYGKQRIDLDESILGRANLVETIFIPDEATNNLTSDQLFKELNKKEFNKRLVDIKTSEFNNAKYKYNISVLCALKLEFDAVVNVLEDVEDNHATCGKVGYIRDKNGNIYKVNIDYMKDDDFGFYAMSECQAKATNIIQHCKPEYLVMTGVMGGVEGKVKIGDVVVGNQAFEWDYSRDLEDEDYAKKAKPSHPYSESLKSSIDLLVKNSPNIVGGDKHKAPFDAQQDLKIKIGLIGTGNSVLNDKNKLDRLIEAEPHMLGFEMEIASLYGAVKEIDEVRAVALKTVVDYGDGTKSKKYQKSGAELSAHIFRKLFTEYIDIG